MEEELLMFLILLVYFLTCTILMVVVTKDDLKPLCKGLENIIKRQENRDSLSIDIMVKEVDALFNTYCIRSNAIRNRYSCVNDWLDEVVMRINIGSKTKYIKELSPYHEQILSIQLIFNQKYPFSKCSDYQQSILKDLVDLRNDSNQLLINNITERAKEEFLRLSKDVKKNDKINKISLMIGILGIIVSVIMAFF